MRVCMCMCARLIIIIIILNPSAISSASTMTEKKKPDRFHRPYPSERGYVKYISPFPSLLDYLSCTRQCNTSVDAFSSLRHTLAAN